MKKDRSQEGVMLKEDREFLMWVVGILITFFFTLPLLYAEEGSIASQNTLPNEQTIQERLGYWKNLKQKDPQAFERLVQKRKEQIKNQFSFLKEREPQKFEALRGAHLEHRRERLQRLRQENPGAFRQIMQEKSERLHQWSERNPDRYQKFLENHPRIAEQVRGNDSFFGPPRQRREEAAERTEGQRRGEFRRFEREDQRRDRPFDRGPQDQFRNGQDQRGDSRPGRGEHFRDRRQNVLNSERPDQDRIQQRILPPARPGIGDRIQGLPSSPREGVGPRGVSAAPRSGGVAARPQQDRGRAEGNAPSRSNARSAPPSGGGPQGGGGRRR